MVIEHVELIFTPLAGGNRYMLISWDLSIMICGTLCMRISLINNYLQFLDREGDFLAVDDLGRGDNRVKDDLDVSAGFKHHLLALANDHYLGVLAVNQDESVAGGDIIFALKLKDFLTIVL